MTRHTPEHAAPAGQLSARARGRARTDAPVDPLEGRKTAIREKARETKSEAGEMMKSYLVGEMAQKIGDQTTKELAEWAVPVQREHIEIVRRAALALAADEVDALV